MNFSWQYRNRLRRTSFVFLFLVFIQSNAFIIQNDLSLVISPVGFSATTQTSNTGQMLLPKADNLDAGFIEWMPEEVLEENTGFIRDLKIAIDGFNNTHVFWVQNIDDNWQLLEKIKFAINDTWNEPQVLSYVTDSNELWMFDVATSNDGKIHLTWENNEQIFYRFYANPTWSPVSFITYGKKPKIDTSISNNPGIIFTQTVLIQYSYYMSHRYAEFSASDDLWEYTEFGLYWDGRESNHDFTTNIKNGKEHFQSIVSHLRRTWNRVERRYYTNFTLDSVSKANDSEIMQTFTIEDNPLPERPFYWNSEPIIISDKENRMHVFVDYWGLNGQEIFCYQYNGGNWGSRIALSTTASPDVSVLHKTAAIDPSGGVTSVWTERRFVNSSIETGILQIKSYKPTAGWSESAYLQTNLTYSRSPHLEFDAAGNAHLVWWEDFEGEKKLHYRFGYGDEDGDGLSNKDELDIYGTDPFDPDTDDDQMLDGEEITNGFDPFNPDQDNDLMLDGWEFHHLLNPLVNDSYLDLDGDMLYNIEEYWEGTLPENNDTDTDDVSDYHEIRTYFTNPFNDDTDDDWVTDGIEINDLGSNPLSNDTDSDGMRDWYEWVYNIKILVNDTTEDPDGDGLWNIYEYQWGINPNKPDHDDDGLLDGDEVLVWFTHPIIRDTDEDNIWDGAEVHTYNTNPLKKDTDDDYLYDWTEITNGLDPLDNDSDNDLLLDGYEFYFNLDPLNSSDANLDYDFDNLTNYQESFLWTNPYNSDTDSDGFTDFEELALGSDPTLADTDQDGLDDYTEIIVLLTNVTNPDTDFDGLLDGLEVHVYFSNPFIQDTDGDTIIDGDEVYIYNTDPSTIHSDSDLLADNLEIIFGTNPNLKDTDFDQMDDFWEWQYGLNGTIDDSALDFDNDNVTNIVEYSKGSNPLLAESDGDGILDYDEIYFHHTHPGMNDTDQDGLSDFEELYNYQTIPYDEDTDDDGLLDGHEIAIGTNPLSIDSDNDGVNDLEELEQGTDPLEPNSNRLRITLITFLIVSSVVLSSLTMYYGVPWVISKRKKNIELLWMKQGLETKRKDTNTKKEEI